MRADCLERHQEALKIGVAIQGLHFAESGAIAMQFMQFEQGRRLHRTLEVQMQFRLG